MKSKEIRQRFLDFFQARGHQVRPSSSLVPADDPTLLFTNAGMVQFKDVFLGAATAPCKRAVTSQKCVRAGGKHNDLEEVGRTARHHTFFEMLGNFSFGDYFKQEAVAYAWEFLTNDLGLEPDRLFVTVHHTDDEAVRLWSGVAGVPPGRIHRLGDESNFWQMADTGPCGPCSEVHYDLRPRAERGAEPEAEEFERRGEAGEFLELWNLVFMQFDRDESGKTRALPAPSIDTGAGLERLCAVLQGVDANYDTDLFEPLLDCVAETLGRPYRAERPDGVSCRVLADHARAVAFLLADGVLPSNEGRGYVLRRILRRGVRHAWLLGRREPTLVRVTEAVIQKMRGPYPELEARRAHVLAAAENEEERFLATIGGGLERLDRIAPAPGGEGRSRREGRPDAERLPREDGPEAEGRAGGRDAERPVLPGAEMFRLHDTFGFPPDLTRLLARERGYEVDMDGFERELAAQRERSRADRRRKGASGAARAARGAKEVHWDRLRPDEPQEFTGYDETTTRTRVAAFANAGEVAGLALERNPFYAEGGGQVSDRGVVSGNGWRMEVEYVSAVPALDGGVAVWGRIEGGPAGGGMLEQDALAEVDGERRRDTQRNHTATHLLHAALKRVLGTHVAQRGSLVAPGRLRFDFAHSGPMSGDEVAGVQAQVNEAVWAGLSVRTEVRSREAAVAAGAVALFGEKYAEEVRVVEVPGVSMELCGGTHVRNTGDIGLVAVVSESGVAAGVRRIEAVTAGAAFAYLADFKRRLESLAASVKAQPGDVERRVAQLADDVADLEKRVARQAREGGGSVEVVAESAFGEGESKVSYKAVRMKARGPDEVRRWGDAFRESGGAGVAVAAAEMPGAKWVLFAFSTAAAALAGARADAVVRAVAAAAGGRGGGKAHIAQGGVSDPEKIDDALRDGAEQVRRLAGGGS